MPKNIAQLPDKELVNLINNRWNSSEDIWKVVNDSYKNNTIMYDMEYADRQRMPDYVKQVSNKQFKVRANRIFSNVEAVINSLIANPPKPNLIPGRNTPESIELAQLQEQYFINRYDELNVKETVRKGLRNLYFGRLIVLKPYWNHKTNDFDCIAIDPRNVRFAKYSTKEVESEFAIEEVVDTLEAVLARFPKKRKEILEATGLSEDQVAIQNPQVKYKEAWIKDRVVFVYNDIILGNIRNPYWDWDGLLVTPQEEEELLGLGGQPRKAKLQDIRMQQEERASAMQMQQGQMMAGAGEQDPSAMSAYQQTVHQTEQGTFNAYKFNHFDAPRKPYIFATVLNNENTPVGRTDFISQATPLQEAVDRRKRQLDDNAEMMNGWVKVDSEVMSKEDAQKLRYETTGVVWGKGVATGVARETGTALPNFIMEDMIDSRQEIDNIMAASSAFRGEREGQETKAGRLALIQQSALRLNELVQVVDYVNQELFNWFYQLAKVRYTETHYAKSMGEQNAVEIMELVQDDFEDGTEVRVTPGRTLPEDQEFTYERAQADVERGIISPIDYFRESGYQNPIETAKNAEIYKLNPIKAVGITDEEMSQIAPQPPAPEPKEPSLSIKYEDLPPDGQIQAAAKAGITLDPQVLMAERMLDDQKKEQEDAEKRRQFDTSVEVKKQPVNPNNKNG